MTRTLYVGDPHVQVSNLIEAEKLLTFARAMARLNQVDNIVILGDLFHTHAIIRVEVQDFWDVWLYALSEVARVIVLTGNHDMSGDHHSTANALNVFRHRGNLTIVDRPLRMGAIGFMPYFHNKDTFVQEANSLVVFGAKTIVCHQSFCGSKFENGYFDPAGINPDELHAEQIISGHIHMGQEFGKVWHPGTAMWLTASDANQTKGLWVVEHDENGKIHSRSMIDTSSIVTPIRSFEWKEGDAKPEVPEGVRATIELIGTSEWIAQHKTEMKGNSIKSTITDSKIKVRTAHKRFEDFIHSEFDLVSTVDKGEFMDFLKELEVV